MGSDLGVYSTNSFDLNGNGAQDDSPLDYPQATGAASLVTQMMRDRAEVCEYLSDINNGYVLRCESELWNNHTNRRNSIGQTRKEQISMGWEGLLPPRTQRGR